MSKDFNGKHMFAIGSLNLNTSVKILDRMVRREESVYREGENHLACRQPVKD